MNAKPPNRSVLRWLLTAVYVLSPLFALCDFGFGLNLRVPVLEEEPGWRIAYYAGMTALGLVMVWVPIVAAPLGIVEAGVNVLLTCLMVILPYRDMLDSAVEGGSVQLKGFPLSAVLVNALIVSIGAMSLHVRTRPKAGA